LGSFLEAGAENLTCFGHCCPTKHGVSSQGKFENASSHDPPSSTLKFAWSFPFGQLTTTAVDYAPDVSTLPKWALPVLKDKKLKERFRLDVRGRSSQRVVRCQHRLTRAVGTPSLKVFKAWLGGALGSLSCWVAALPIAGGWNSVTFKVPSNPRQSRIL